MTLLDFRDLPTTAFAEAFGSHHVIDQEMDVEQVELAYDRLKAVALSPEASIGMIIAAMEGTWWYRS